jgi:terminase, large subunit
MQTSLPLESSPQAFAARRLPPGKRWVPIIRRARLALRKRAQRPVSAWAEDHRVVPADSPIPGYWRNATTPYLVGIMDAAMFPSVQELVVCAPPQTGKTDLALNLIGYSADHRPGNWLIVYPDEKTAGDMSRDRVQPLFNDSPRLRRYLTGAADDLAALRITLKHMRVYLAWSTSAARLASRPLPYVLLDEVDKFPATAGRKEGSPVDLARKRTRTFGHMRKFIRVSTPTIEAGPIWRALNEECEAVFVYWVRCPLCEAWQQMEFTAIKWEGGRSADSRQILSDQRSTWYECTACRGKWDDARRDQAVAAGEWRDRDEGIKLESYLTARRPVVIGFHYRAWVSRFVPMREAAAAFIRSENDKVKLRDFRNDYSAEPWHHYKEDRVLDRVLSLVEDRPRGVVPRGNIVSALTAGVDTQDDGFWYWIHAWGYQAAAGQRPTSWCVRAGFVLDLAALAQVLWADRYIDTDGRSYVVGLTLQDALGHRTAEVYDFCRMRPGRIFPSFGRQRMASPYSFSDQQKSPQPGRVFRGALRAVNVNTSFFKNEAAAALAVDLGDPGGVRLHAEFPHDYAAHLVSEFINDEGAWECPPGRPNHLWDCLCLAFTAAEIYGVRHRSRHADGISLPDPVKDSPAAPHEMRRKMKQGASHGNWMEGFRS